MKLADQTDETYRSNVGKSFDGLYSIFMVIIQPKLIANDKVVKC